VFASERAIATNGFLGERYAYDPVVAEDDHARNESARAHIQWRNRKEFRLLSPVFLFSGRLYGSVAVTFAWPKKSFERIDMRFLAQSTTSLCVLWLGVYFLWGGSPTGKQWYTSLAQSFFEDYKGGVAVLTLILPVLLAGTSCSLFLKQQPEYVDAASRRQPRLRTVLALFAPPHQLPVWMHRWMHRVGTGDTCFDQLSFYFILWPVLIFLLCNIYRHLSDDLDRYEAIMETANAFGIAALASMSVFLVPVSRHSAVLALWGWSPVHAVRLHVWSGRIIMIASLVHGAMHAYNWSVMSREGLFALLIPPSGCWTLKETVFAPTCRNPDTDCSCYDHFRNLTGALAGTALVVIGLTSCNFVRRKCYALFFHVHVIAGPLVLLMTILHWNRSILYMGGGVLYYIASSFPVLVETSSSCASGPSNAESNSTAILKAERLVTTIPGRSSQECVSLTVAASNSAVQRFRAGQYVRLSVPKISSKAHPFSVNLVPGESNQLRVIFRVRGYFTSQLKNHLLRNGTSDMASEQPRLPRIRMDGFHGSPNRVDQVLQHDVAVLVAGGIGITPYLSLLHKVHSIAMMKRDGIMRTRKVVLHWICRDQSLIEYIQREYFDPLLEHIPGDGSNSGNRAHKDFVIQIVIHRTATIDSRHQGSRRAASYSDLENPQGDDFQQPEEDVSSIASLRRFDDTIGLPFSPSAFAAGSKNTYRGNMVLTMSFVTIAWTGLLIVWYLYYNVQDAHEISSRLWSPIILVALGLAVSVAANWLVHNVWPDEDLSAPMEWSPLVEEDDTSDTLELHEMVTDSNKDVVSRSEMDPDGVVRTSTLTPNTGDSLVTMEYRDGRPTVHSLINAIEEAKHPALFTCGPILLQQEVRATAQERCCMRFRRCLQGQENSHIALYEEVFEI
jgi:predicted ferric reductase